MSDRQKRTAAAAGDLNHARRLNRFSTTCHDDADVGRAIRTDYREIE